MKQITFGGNKNVISAALKEFRQKRNLSQGELAAKMQTMNANIDQQMISKIEKISVRLPIMNLPAFADVLIFLRMSYLKILRIIWIKKGRTLFVLLNIYKIKDAIITIFKDKSVNELESSEGIESVKLEIKNTINSILESEMVLSIYFTNLLVN